MTLKRFWTILSLALLCCVSAAQEGYYTNTAGTTLKWVIHDGSGGVYGYCHEKLVRLEGDRNDAAIHYSYRFYDNANNSVTGDKSFHFNVTLAQGLTRAYVNNVAMAIQAGDYMPVGDLSSIPDDIAVGDRLRDSEIKVKILNVFTATNLYKNRRVTARETVRTAAGTFDCFLVEDEETFTGSGPFRVQTWVAKGVGMVRQIIYKKDGTVNQTFELIK